MNKLNTKLQTSTMTLWKPSSMPLTSVQPTNNSCTIVWQTASWHSPENATRTPHHYKVSHSTKPSSPAAKKKTLSKLKHHSLTQNFRTNKTRDLKTGLGRLVHDNRQDLRSNLLLQITASAPDNPRAPPIVSRYNSDDDTSHQASPPSSQRTLRKRRATYKREEEEAARRRGAAQPQLQINVHNTVMAMPSAEVRDAMRSFREVVEACVEVVNATGRVERELENVAKR